MKDDDDRMQAFTDDDWDEEDGEPVAPPWKAPLVVGSLLFLWVGVFVLLSGWGW
jgi:hypothetical protein